MRYEEFIDQFERHGKSDATGCMVSCPGAAHANGDRNPSLHVTRGKESVLLNCFAGCTTEEIVAALDLGLRDLFYEPREATPARSSLQLPADYLSASYTYINSSTGLPHMTVERWIRPDGSKTFKQRGPGGGYGLPKGFKPCLYRMPELLAAIDRGETILICEGEKDVEACRRRGITATTAPMGAGKWLPYYWRWLQHAKRVVVVADDDSVGRKHAATIAADLAGHGLQVSCVRAQVGKDISDHFAAQHTVDELVPINPEQVRPLGIRHSELRVKHFDPVCWAIPGLLSAGLALLGGPPKQGKSWLALDFALGVGFGGITVSKFACERGDVLYLSLDNDSERRLAQRAAKLLEQRAEDDLPIEFHVEWPTGLDAVKACREWIHEAPAPKLIVVDTLVKVEPSFDAPDYKAGAYGHSTDVLTRWAKLASDTNVCILVVHHDRKAGWEDGDWIDRFTGSRGVTATASTLLFLDAQRGADEGTLHLTGRDIGEYDIPLRRLGPYWLAEEAPPLPPELCPNDLSSITGEEC